MYQGKRKNKRWTIQEKNEIVLLYLDQHIGWNKDCKKKYKNLPLCNLGNKLLHHSLFNY